MAFSKKFMNNSPFRKEEEPKNQDNLQYTTRKDSGMSDAEYAKYFGEGSIHRPNLDEVNLGVVNKKNPNSKKTSEEKSGYTKSLDAISDTLTLAGMAPGYGAVADAANLIFATGRTLSNVVGDTYKGATSGDFDYGKTLSSLKDMGWATAGIIPIAGQLASGAKLGNKVVKSAKAVRDSKALDVIDKIHHSKLYHPTKTAKVLKKNIGTDNLANTFSSSDKPTGLEKSYLDYAKGLQAMKAKEKALRQSKQIAGRYNDKNNEISL